LREREREREIGPLGMAAIRSVLAMVGRRSCGSSGSTAAASFGGTGMEIHQVFRHSAPRTPPLPSLRPAGHSLESYRRFSTGGRVPADEAENGLRMWWHRCMYRIKNADLEQRSKFLVWYSTFVLVSTTCYMMKTRKALRRIKI